MTPAKPDGGEKLRVQRRQELLDAALSLFAEKGYHDTKVADIAARAGVAQGTVYLYFDSKEELFEAAFVGRMEAMARPFLDVASQEHLSPSARLRSIAEGSVDVVADGADVSFLMLQVLATRDVARIVAFDFREYYDRFRRALEPMFAALGEADPASTAAAFMGLLDGLMLHGMIDPEMSDRDKVLAQVFDKFHLQEEDV